MAKKKPEQEPEFELEQEVQPQAEPTLADMLRVAHKINCNILKTTQAQQVADASGDFDEE